MLETLLQPGETKERCGVVMDDGNVVEIANIAAEPEHSFEMEPVAFLELVKTGRVRGTWHTHFDGPPVLSGEDYNTFIAWPDLEHSIIGFENGKATVQTYRSEHGVLLTCD
jgi:proteasome lid subunit RPN8/RPN11